MLEAASVFFDAHEKQVVLRQNCTTVSHALRNIAQNFLILVCDQRIRSQMKDSQVIWWSESLLCQDSVVTKVTGWPTNIKEQPSSDIAYRWCWRNDAGNKVLSTSDVRHWETKVTKWWATCLLEKVPDEWEWITRSDAYIRGDWAE